MKIQLSDHFTCSKLLRFTLPSIVMMVFTSIYGVVDGFFVSNYVGKTPFTAVNFIYPVIMILGCVGFMFGTGGGALIAKTLGEGKPERANHIFSLIVYTAAVCGVVLGAVAALRRNKIIDRIIMVVTTAFVSMPSFIMGSLLLVVFVVKLQLLPGNGSAQSGPAGLVLPIITLALYPMAYITRLTRSSMLDVLGQDYIRTARAKGVSGRRIIFGHALKNSLIPVITYVGPMLAYIVTGSLVVEKIFAVAGVGRAFVNSIINRDYPLVMGTTIVLAVLIVVMNLLSDILYKVVDPRISFD